MSEFVYRRVPQNLDLNHKILKCMGLRKREILITMITLTLILLLELRVFINEIKFQFIIKNNFNTRPPKNGLRWINIYCWRIKLN